METKGILRVVLLIVSSLMMLGSICDKKGPAEPIPGPGEPVPDIHLSANSGSTLWLGEVEIGESKVGWVTVHNTGTADLIFETPTTNGEPVFKVLSNTLAPITTNDCETWVTGVIKPSKYCFISVQFAPEEVGLQISLLFIKSNDPDESLVIINLEGKGVLPTSPNIVPPPEPAPKPSRSGKYPN